MIRKEREQVTIPIDEALVGAREKICEADFFLRLMDRTELMRQPLIEGNDLAREFTFYLSALLNACYSVVSYLKESDRRASELAIKFFRDHGDYYARRTGLRSALVHLRPLKPHHHGYIPPPGNNVILRFREPRREQQGGSVGFDFSVTGRYYFQDEGSSQNSIGDLCAVHIGALRRLVEDCEKVCR
jgi:hypothetical protein